MPRLHVVECSEAQCRDLARQLEARWRVEARPWPLERSGAPDAGTVVATFFHYNELRTRWPERLHSVRFVTIRPDPATVERVRSAAGAPAGPAPITVTLCELDEPTLEAVAADVSLLLPTERFRLRTAVIAGAPDALGAREHGPVLLPPRVWSRVEREGADMHDARLVQLRYVFDDDELGRLGHALGLRPHSVPSEVSA